MMSEAKAGEATSVEALEEKLKALVVTKGTFFTTDRAEKARRIQAQVDDIVGSLDTLPDTTSKGYVAYVHGKALEAHDSYSKEAEDLLSKAVKLDPANVDAWNCLGQCFWKKKDLAAARDCFNGALAQKPNPESLRLLSMLLRQMGDTEAERAANVAESVNKAKEAIKMDVSDTESWYVLGNAYLSTFFMQSHNPGDLTLAMKAYGKADEHGTSRNPDLHFNRGMVYKFQEEYTDAAAAFQTALEIDPSLPGEDQVEGISRFVSRVSEMVERKGRIKGKKLNALVKALPADELRKRLAESKAPSKEAEDGKAAVGAGAGASDKPDPEFTSVSELSEGANVGKWVMLKLLMPALRTGESPQCLVMMDEKRDAVCVSLYHTTENACDRFNSERDTFIVCDPFLKNVEFDKADGTTVSYKTLQVLKPGNFSVNGRTLSGQYAHAGLSVKSFAS